MSDALDFVSEIHDADLHLVWLMLFAAEHGVWIGGVSGATMLMVAVAVVGQLLGLMGLLPVAAGLVGTAAAVFVPHGCYAIAVLFGVVCILNIHTKKKSAANTEETLLEAAFSTDAELSEDCPPKFCF